MRLINKKVKCLILRAPGTNCDEETKLAFEKAKSQAKKIHISEIIRNPKILNEYHILTIPGGFTYGDDISAGKVLANEIRAFLFDELCKLVQDGKLILGICNGFQVLVKLGLIPMLNGEAKQTCTLTNNKSGRFEDRWVYLRVEHNISEFIKEEGMILQMPVAHGEGNFVADNSTLKKITKNKQIVFKYVRPDGKKAVYPFNPNGSALDIAGVCDQTGRILGMMPHPERYSEATQHPQWTRYGLKSIPDGLKIFKNAVDYAKKNL